MKKIHFIINPQAKNGYSLKVWTEVEKSLKLADIMFKAHFTEHQGHATRIAETIKMEEQVETIIVVIGGDGTVHEVMNGIVGAKHIKVGFIPGGSGNDFSRGYRIPRKPNLALQFLLEQKEEKPQYVDIGEIVHDHDRKTFFINNMGAGFDALITKEASGSPLKKFLNRFSLGNLIYAYFVIKKLFTYKCTKVIVTIDGKEYRFENTWFVTVSNQPYYGGGMKISPDASVVDGKLNITVVSNLSRFKFLMVFITVFWGGHIRFKEVTSFDGKNISIVTEEKVYVHADGEYIGETPLEIKAMHKVVPLLIQKLD
jgi:diacylglycerol kinase (ATP)